MWILKQQVRIGETSGVPKKKGSKVPRAKVQSCEWMHENAQETPGEAQIAPLPVEIFIFQPFILRAFAVSFREGICWGPGLSVWSDHPITGDSAWRN